MSRTDKDRPYDIIVYDRAAYRSTPRHTYHWHHLFGRKRTRSRAVKDERGNFVYTFAEETHWVIDWSGRRPTYRQEMRTVKRRVFEEVPAGVYADYCTAHINPSDMPKGILSPCRTFLGRMRQGGSNRDEVRDWHAGDRRQARDTLRRYAAEYRGSGDLDDDDDLETRHRHGASWWD